MLRDVISLPCAYYIQIIRHASLSPEAVTAANLMQNCKTTSTFALNIRNATD